MFFFTLYVYMVCQSNIWQSIFTEPLHLKPYGSHPGYVANMITNDVYQTTSPAYTMLIPGNDGTFQGVLIRDVHNAQRGEALHINPVMLEHTGQWGEKLESTAMYRIVTTPASYRFYGAEPAGEFPPNDKPTPVDLLTDGLPRTLLHEVSVY